MNTSNSKPPFNAKTAGECRFPYRQRHSSQPSTCHAGVHLDTFPTTFRRHSSYIPPLQRIEEEAEPSYNMDRSAEIKTYTLEDASLMVEDSFLEAKSKESGSKSEESEFKSEGSQSQSEESRSKSEESQSKSFESENSRSERGESEPESEDSMFMGFTIGPRHTGLYTSTFENLHERGRQFAAVRAMVGLDDNNESTMAVYDDDLEDADRYNDDTFGVEFVRQCMLVTHERNSIAMQ